MDPVIKEWAYAREVMRRFGFPADDLYFHVSDAGTVTLDGVDYKVNRLVVSLVLNSQDKTFVWTIGLSNLPSKEEVHEAYLRLCETWNSQKDESEFMEAFEKSDSYKQTVPLAKALHDKGFVIGGN